MTLDTLSVDLPTVPPDCVQNAHLFRVLVPRGIDRRELLAAMNRNGVNAVFHYVPLHSSPAGRRFGRVAGEMAVTDDCSARLVRLPLWVEMGADAPARVVNVLSAAIAAHV